MTRRTLFGRIVAAFAVIAGYRTSRPAVIGMDEIGLRPLLKNGSAGLQTFRDEAKQLGLSVSGIDLSKTQDMSVLSINEYRRLANLPYIG